jgi:regulatory protein
LARGICSCCLSFPEISNFKFEILGSLASPPASAYPSVVYSRSAPRKFATEQGLYNAALRALMRRAHSIHQMREYLEIRAEEKDHAAQVIARLREQNYLDDARYALEFARSHANSRRQGRFRIARELRTRGVPDRYIESALDSVFDETDEATLIRTRLKRLLSRNQKPLDRRKLASIYSSLLRAGFSGDAIRSELRHVNRHEAAEARDFEQE